MVIIAFAILGIILIFLSGWLTDRFAISDALRPKNPPKQAHKFGIFWTNVGKFLQVGVETSERPAYDAKGNRRFFVIMGVIFLLAAIILKLL